MTIQMIGAPSPKKPNDVKAVAEIVRDNGGIVHNFPTIN